MKRYDPADELARTVITEWYGRDISPNDYEIERMNHALDAYDEGGAEAALAVWFDEVWHDLDSRRREDKTRQFDTAVRTARAEVLS